MFKPLIFIAASLLIIAYSWPSFRNRRSHGYYRFFAFELLVLLVLVNVDRWTVDPFSTQQVLSWFLLTCSLVLVFQGAFLILVVGKPRGNFENTTHLVTNGIYRYVRHPLYSSLLFLTWGIFLKECTFTSILLTGAVSVLLVATARAEESENLEKFGKEYEAYMKSTRKFIPFLYCL